LLLPSGTGNTTSEIYNQINVSILQNCKTIAEKLHDFMQVNFGGRQITIVSNWRSQQNNARLSNAAKESTHLKGAAIDFDVVGMPNYTAFKTFYKYWDGFTYRYEPSRGNYMIHVQTGAGAGGAKRLYGQTA
jgi:uncharacterized protein YcbK (DUF882 family)